MPGELHLQEVDDANKFLGAIHEINSMTLVSGYNMTAGQGSAGGNAVISLKPWNEQERTADEVTAEINRCRKRL